jgi:hypothetical protein
MDLRGIAQRLQAIDPAAADRAAVAVGLRNIQQMRGQLDSLEGNLTRRAKELHEQGDGPPAADLLTRHNRTSRRRAEQSERRAEVLGEAPQMEKQLAKGRISTEHADALASALGRLDDDERFALFDLDADLAVAAASKTPGQFRRFVDKTIDELKADDGLERWERQRSAARLNMGKNDDTGMGWIYAELHPEDYQSIERSIDDTVAILRHRSEHEGKRPERLRALALVALTGAPTGQISAAAWRRKPSLIVGVDYPTLVGGIEATGRPAEFADGSPIPIEAVRRIACEADIIPVVLGGDGMPLDVGRSSRLATPPQRAALRTMYRTCALDDCDIPFDDCDIHHLVEWGEHLGETNLDDLLPLCSRDHHRAHEGGWRLELDPATRELSVWLPDGMLRCRCLPDLVAERGVRPDAA